MVEAGGQKQRQTAAEAVVKESGGGCGRVECAIGRRRRGRGRAGFQRSGLKGRVSWVGDGEPSAPEPVR